MLPLNKSYNNRKVSLTIHCKYKYFDSTVQRAEDRRQKFYFCRLPFGVNVKLNLSYTKKIQVTLSVYTQVYTKKIQSSSYCVIVRVSVVLKRTVVGD